MTTEELENDEVDSPEVDVIPWCSAIQAFTKFGKTAKQLRDLVKARKLRTKKINGRDNYSTEDLTKLSEDGDEDAVVDTSMADLIRASTGQVAQSHKHLETMFDKYMVAFDKLLQRDGDLIEKQNAHIRDLEAAAIKMHEATEKVFSLEHERRLGELKEERTREMQSKAINVLATTLGPWVASKLGGAIPGMPGVTPPGTPESGGADRAAQLGSAVVNMVVNMTDEEFRKLLEVLPPPEGMVLNQIREAMKSA